MKETYPYLAHWKQCGLDDFPSPPPDQLAEDLVRHHMEKVWESYRKRQKDKLDENEGSRALHEILPDGFLEDTEAMYMAGLEEKIEEEVSTKLKKHLDREHERIFRRASEAHKRIQSSQEPGIRDQAIRNFADKYIPDTQGGGLALTNFQKSVLKRIYNEMQSCIKYVRKKIEPHEPSHSKHAIWKHYEDEENKELVLENVPQIDVIFTEDELPLLFKESSAATPAAKIILKRLQKFSPRFNITPRTLRDILTGITPL